MHRAASLGHDTQGWRQEFFDKGADSSDEEDKIWFSGTINAKNLRKIVFHLPIGASMLRQGAIAP